MNLEKKFPWYDSAWLRMFAKTKEALERKRPELLNDFLNTTNQLRTDEDFKVRSLSKLFDQKTLIKIKQRISALSAEQIENQESFSFGRLLVRNDPFFNSLQNDLIEMVSEQVKEEVEISYNFLSLYSNLGVCPIHLDSPTAKWTLDICIDQSTEWPIYISQVKPWPDYDKYSGQDWQDKILEDPENKFLPYVLKPGDGIIFSGSSQYHYRDRIYTGRKNDYCHLIFFHFIPKGCKNWISPKKWPERFGL
jgi:hypothetical protein